MRCAGKSARAAAAAASGEHRDPSTVWVVAGERGGGLRVLVGAGEESERCHARDAEAACQRARSIGGSPARSIAQLACANATSISAASTFASPRATASASQPPAARLE